MKLGNIYVKNILMEFRNICQLNIFNELNICQFKII